MTPSDPGVPVPILLEALRLRVRSSSLRKAAAEAGLSPNAIRSLIRGAKPHPSTVRKLREWFDQLNEVGDAGLSLEAAEAALILLVQALPDDSQRRALNAVLSTLEAQYLREDIRLPSGLEKLREKIDAG